MNKIMIGLSLLASLGLASISSQAHAGERHHQRDDHNYTYSYVHEERRTYRKGYRDARREHRQHRKHRRVKQQRRHARSHYQHRRHEREHHHGYNGHDRHRRVYHRPDNDWRVVFKF